MNRLSVEQVLLFHKKTIERSGGSHGIRDISLIESALNRYNATFDSQDLYTDIVEKIAVTTVSLVKNHGFVDGNKRVGITVMLMLLKLNGLFIKYTQQELIELGLGLASGDLNEDDVQTWINSKIEE
jgi:death-on-curing protein